MRRSAWACLVALGVSMVVASSGAAQDDPGEVDSLPDTIPIFPLQDVTLFPTSTAPFHIFEPRYREMVADALAGDSIIGMAHLQPGYEADYEGRPPVYAVGCAGVIIRSEELPDGRYNIVLRGLVKFRILGEDQSRSYRLAEVEAVEETVQDADRELLARRRRQLELAFLTAFPQAQAPPQDLADEEVIDGLSLILPLEPLQRQQLLEADGPIERASTLVGFLRGGLRAAP